MNIKIHWAIISVIIFFSSIIQVSANEWYLSQFLELETWVEVYEFENIPKLNPRNFSNINVQHTFNKFLKVDTLLRKEIIAKYRNKEISTYQMQDIIRSYWIFIYHTGKTFWYIDRNQRGLRGTEIEAAIANWYAQMRMSYGKVQWILSNKF